MIWPNVSQFGFVFFSSFAAWILLLSWDLGLRLWDGLLLHGEPARGILKSSVPNLLLFALINREIIKYKKKKIVHLTYFKT